MKDARDDVHLRYTTETKLVVLFFLRCAQSGRKKSIFLRTICFVGRLWQLATATPLGTNHEYSLF